MKLVEIYREIKKLNENIIQQPEFITLVHDWVENPEKKTSDKLMKYKNQIPGLFRKSSELYRGMHLPIEKYEVLMSGKTIQQDGVRSWSHDANVAKKFLLDAKFSISSGNRVKIVVKKHIESKNILLDVYQYYLFISGSSDFKWDELAEDSIKTEKEVLCYDVEIRKSDIIQKF